MFFLLESSSGIYLLIKNAKEFYSSWNILYLGPSADSVKALLCLSSLLLGLFAAFRRTYTLLKVQEMYVNGSCVGNLVHT